MDTPVWPAQESGQRLAHAMERDVASMTSDLKALNNIFGDDLSKTMLGAEVNILFG